MPSQQATIGDVPVRWEESGTGTPVVLVHGIPTSPDLWRHVTPWLPGVRVLAFELVGYGRRIPAGHDRDISVAAQAGYLSEWLDHLGTGPAVLVGHDLGGGVAQIVAVRRPDLCAGLVLTNAVSYDSWPIPIVKALRALAGVVGRAPDVTVHGIIATLMLRGHDDLRMARESLGVHARHYTDHDGVTALARQAAALDVRDTLAVADQLPQLDVPARIVWGVADQFLKARYGERLARDLGTRPVGIRGGKHFTPEDHPHMVAAAVRDVLDQLS